eukprot:jgi/Orpsp1_1/1187856/evm.model.d7180000060737.1
MVRRLAFKTLSFGLLSSLVISASTISCEELREYFDKKQKNAYFYSCSSNDDGKINNLDISFNDKEKLKSESIEKIFSIDSLEYFGLNRVIINQNVIDKISTLKQLKELILYDLDLSESNFNFDSMNNLKKLTKLKVYEEKMGKPIFKMISNISNLKELYLSRAYSGSILINESDLKLLSDLYHLKILDIDEVDEEQESIKNICKYVNAEKVTINRFDVRDCSSDSDVSINECSELRSFMKNSNANARIGECEINNEGKLINVNIYGIEEELQSKILEKLFSYDTIKSLNFNNIKMNQKTVDKIISLSQLEKLTFYESKIANSKLNFDGFKKLNKVTELYVVEDKDFTRDVFEMITKFSNLNSLSLEHTGSGYTWVKEEDYKLLENLKSLESIEIDGNDAHINYCVGSIEKLYFNGHFHSCYSSDNKCEELKKDIEGYEYGNENIIDNCKTDDEGNVVS